MMTSAKKSELFYEEALTGALYEASCGAFVLVLGDGGQDICVFTFYEGMTLETYLEIDRDIFVYSPENT